MNKITNRGRLLASTILLGSVAFATAPAFAQQSADNDLQEIVVTGSRIKSPNLTSDSPVTSVSSKDITYQGTTNIETLLNNLPSVFAGQTQAASNGATGAATINLRGLGSSRTLVLIDGKRLNQGDPTDPAADINMIPAQLVEGVDVLTGGASAVYGSDAVAGVVNFKMKRDFEGVQADFQVNAAQHENNHTSMQNLLRSAHDSVPDDQFGGYTRQTSFIFGVNSDNHKGNVTAYATYQRSEPVNQGKYDWSACGLDSVQSGDSTPYDTHVCGGSNSAPNGVKITNSTGALMPNPNGAGLVAYNKSNAYNFAPTNYLQRDDTRYTGGFMAHYEINPAVDVYTDFMFMHDETVAQIAPSGLFGDQYNINCNNPLMDSATATALCGAAAGTSQTVSVALGSRFTAAPRQYDMTHTDYRYVIGVRGDLGSGWSYDVSGQQSNVQFSELVKNQVSKSKAQDGLLVGGTAANPVCLSGDSTCVPLNIFSAGGLTSAQQQSTFVNSVTTGTTSEQVISANLNGDLGSIGGISPLAHDPVYVSFGTEYRREGLTQTADTESQSGDISGSGGAVPPTTGSYDVKELFGEVKVPLVQDVDWVKDLTFDGAYRWSQYSLAGDVDAWKLGLTYAPTSDITFRGGFNRAVRAPNILELFDPSEVTLNASGSDPCAGAAPTASLTQCQRTGVTAGQYGHIDTPSGQLYEKTGGNLNLRPETADTWTVGAVLTPSFLPNFTLSIDYFDIRISQMIGTIPYQNIMSGCMAGNDTYCSYIHRGVNGTLANSTGYVDALDINTGYENERGIDFVAAYRYDLDQLDLGRKLGSLNFSFNGTWLTDFTYDPVPGQSAYDCNGLYGLTCGTPNPMWRHTARLTWDTPWQSSVSFAWRHLSSVSLDCNHGGALDCGLGAQDTVDGRIPSYDYFDLAITQNIADHYTVRFGVDNLFDKDPPLIDSSNIGISSAPLGNGNTYPGVYDSLGRVFFLGVTANY